MSTSASVAAAKKRRSQPTLSRQPISSSSSSSATSCQRNNNNCKIQTTYKSEQGHTTPLQLLKQHDYRIHCLENTSHNLDGDYATKKDLELLTLERSTSSIVDNKITNKIENNSGEIISLRNTINQLTRTIKEANNTITTMKATLLPITSELTELKQLKIDFYNFIENNVQVSEDAEEAEEAEDANPVEDNKEANKQVELTVAEVEK